MDKQLADLLGITTSTLEELKVFTSNNAENIYATLVREYAIYKTLINLAIVGCIVLLISILVAWYIYDERYSFEDVNKKLVLIPIIACIFILGGLISPILAPNISLIQSLMGG